MKTCASCHTDKSLSDFSKGKNRCKSCICEWVRQHHLRNDRAGRRTKKKIKMSASCSICGEERDDLIQFDHRGEKEFTIGSQTPGARRILAEQSKCRFLCIWCHRLHSLWQRNERKQSRGTRTTPHDPNGRSCKGEACGGKRVPLNCFYKKRGRPVGKCKNCRYAEEAEKRERNLDHINLRKREAGMCTLCGIKVELGEEVCFDFDHLDPSKKTQCVSRFACIGADKRREIDTEIAKCRLLCCVCHFYRTKVQQGC